MELKRMKTLTVVYVCVRAFRVIIQIRSLFIVRQYDTHYTVTDEEEK